MAETFLPSFALIAEYSTSGDGALPPQVSFFAVPSTAAPHQSIDLLWYTFNVGQIEITGNNGVDYQPGGFDSGRISTSGSGIYIVSLGFTVGITLTLTAYDAMGNPLGITKIVVITIT
jgi:hypothetical protein